MEWAIAEGELLNRVPNSFDGPAWRTRMLAAGRLLREKIEGEQLEWLTSRLLRLADQATLEGEFGHRLTANGLSDLIAKDPTPLVLRLYFARALELTANLPEPPAPVHSVRSRAFGMDPRRVDEQIESTLIRLCGAYLDTGLAYWPMPSREEGFFEAVRLLALHTSSVPGRTRHQWRETIEAMDEDERSASEVVLKSLRALGVADEDWESYLTETLLALPGWAGMFYRLETKPALRMRSLPYSLMDYLAVRLTLERAAVAAIRKVDHLPEAPSPLVAAHEVYWLFLLGGMSLDAINELGPAEGTTLTSALHHFGSMERRRVFQEAYERTYRREILDGIARNARLQRSIEPAKARIQLACCIDDREESLRRHFEELDPHYETFGIAGYYGLAISYRGLTAAHGSPLCPASMSPSHQISEVAEDEAVDASWRKRWVLAAKLGFAGHVGTRSLFRGFGLSLAGAVQALPMAVRIFAPRTAHLLWDGLGDKLAPPPRTRLTALRETEVLRRTTPLPEGLSVPEAVERVAGVLEDMGMTRAFAPLVIVLGHGSTSMNNPHEAAHECGACSGGKGGPNARLFADLLGRDEVRAGLRDHGIEIPDGTFFVGGIHDTSDDAVDLFDLHRVPDTHAELLVEARDALDRARAVDALERARRFTSTPLGVAPAIALRQMEARAQDLAQPRPEYGHCTNAVCLVGRRWPNRGLFLDRRAFLVSYDPAADPDSGILERLLASVVPVGAGINLEYYFSYVDQRVYGSGTKLPHNVTGLVGVMDGHESDLRTGLPHQMVDIHEPMRLLCVVEAKVETLLTIAERQPEVGRLVQGRWIQLVAMDPDTGALSVLGPSGFEPYEPREPLHSFPTSTAYFGRTRDNLPPARILAGLPSTEAPLPTEEPSEASVHA